MINDRLSQEIKRQEERHIENLREIGRAGEVQEKATAHCATGSAQMGACRQSGRLAILDRASRLEEEARRLRALAASIPENFPGDADEALWQLATRAR
jgi:predicted secreted Zn-dependent protease